MDACGTERRRRLAFPQKLLQIPRNTRSISRLSSLSAPPNLTMTANGTNGAAALKRSASSADEEDDHDNHEQHGGRQRSRAACAPCRQRKRKW